MIIDGCFYQNEGANPVLDSKNFASYAAAKEHTHDYIPLSGSANLTGYFIPAEHDRVVLGNPSRAFSQVFATNFKVVNTFNNTIRLEIGAYGSSDFKYSQPSILFWFMPDGGGLKQLTLGTEEITQSRTLKLPDKSGTLTTNTTVSDWNEAITSGFYNALAAANNAPVSDACITGNVFATGNMIVQTVYPESTDSTELISYTRKGINNSGIITWTKWIRDITILKTYIIKGYKDAENLFKKLIPSTTKSIIFTDIKMPSDATLIDVDDDGDNGVVAWLDTNDNTKMYVSTQYKGVKVEGNKNSVNMFNGCTNLASLDLSSLNTSNVTDMTSMFNGCKNLASLDVSNWDTSNVAYMGCMFYNCNNLTSLDVSNFDTSKVTNMSSMFYYCSKLTSLDVSNFDTSNVTNMYGMFNYCYNLIELDISKWNPTKITDTSYMFNGCSKLTKLDLANFDTSKVTNMGSMFRYCSALTTLEIYNFDTSKVTNMDNMFGNCTGLTTIMVGKTFKWICTLATLGLSGTWKDETGTRYTSDDTFPSNVAHTYTKVS